MLTYKGSYNSHSVGVSSRFIKSVYYFQVKAEDVIKAFISRCKEINPMINAIVEDRFEQAIADARQMDILLASEQHTVEDLEKQYPLLGVPLTVKESIAVAGELI